MKIKPMKFKPMTLSSIAKGDYWTIPSMDRCGCPSPRRRCFGTGGVCRYCTRWGSSLSFLRCRSATHLPQGAPTSPGLANLAANGIDRRLDGLAKKHHATYTRYADDLFVSGDDRLFQRAKSFSALTEYLIASEGFRVHHGKTAHMTNAGRQQLLGLVVNDHPAIARTEFDALRATLHNCVRFGSESQRRDQTVDFRSHLLGRIGWVAFVNPQRGARLMSVFNQITWLKQQ
jgi:RNA-directed DNA polymerase